MDKILKQGCNKEQEGHVCAKMAYLMHVLLQETSWTPKYLACGQGCYQEVMGCRDDVRVHVFCPIFVITLVNKKSASAEMAFKLAHHKSVAAQHTQ